MFSGGAERGQWHDMGLSKKKYQFNVSRKSTHTLILHANHVQSQSPDKLLDTT